MTFFNSLKVRLWLTARALRMPRRKRSWMSRSSLGAVAFSARTRLASPLSFRTAPDLATEPPCDHYAEHDLQDAESRGQEPVAPLRGGQYGNGSQDQKAHPHERDHAHGKGAAREHARAIDQQPDTRQLGGEAIAEEHQREQRSDEDGRQQRQQKFHGGTPYGGGLRLPQLDARREETDRDGDQRLDNPNREPVDGIALARRDRRGGKSRDSHNDTALTGDGGEGCGRLHGAADEAQVIE